MKKKLHFSFENYERILYTQHNLEHHVLDAKIVCMRLTYCLAEIKCHLCSCSSLFHFFCFLFRFQAERISLTVATKYEFLARSSNTSACILLFKCFKQTSNIENSKLSQSENILRPYSFLFLLSLRLS